MQVENFPPHFEHHPEHDHSDDGQEEVYTALSGPRRSMWADEEFQLEPGVFARIGPGERRKVTTGDEPVQLLGDRRDSRRGVRGALLHRSRRPAARVGAVRRSPKTGWGPFPDGGKAPAVAFLCGWRRIDQT